MYYFVLQVKNIKLLERDQFKAVKYNHKYL